MRNVHIVDEALAQFEPFSQLVDAWLGLIASAAVTWFGWNAAPAQRRAAATA
jgi:hypothetical protein